MPKKIITFLYSIYNSTSIELNYITRVYLYIKSKKFLNDNIDILIFDDTPENKFKDYFDKLDIKILNIQKNVKRIGSLNYILDIINSEFVKIIDPDDYLILDWLDKLVKELKNLKDYDYILHPFYFLKKNLKYRNYHQIRHYNFNIIFSVEKLKKNQNEFLKNLNFIYSEDQYLGMVADLNSKYKKIKIPFYIYNRNSETSIINNIKEINKMDQKIEDILSEIDISFNFYKKHENEMTYGVNPRFIRLVFFKTKFENKLNVYKYIRKRINSKRIYVKLWIIYACFLKFRWQ